MARPLVIHGTMLAVIELAGLLHPRIIMPAKTDVAGDGSVITETRRIITIPVYVSVAVIVVGGVLLFRSNQKPE